MKFLEFLARLWFTLWLQCIACPAATLVVTTTSDSGPGSLRQAIMDANAIAGADIVQFNIPGAGVQTIAPLTPLPDITNSVMIDGYSQPGSSTNAVLNGNSATLLVRLDGVNLTNSFPFAIGLRLSEANNITVRGLMIVRFYTGIEINDSSGNSITGNWIGMDADGISRGGAGTGVNVTCAVFSRSTANVIGGLTPGDRNVIAGHHTGISFSPFPADHNTVQGNFIGTDPTGSLPRGHLFDGIVVQSATNILIGGPAPGARNLICSSGTGIYLLGSSGETIQGNYIGTDVTAHYALGNSGDGIGVQGCALTTIGGTNAGNLIVNNAGHGIFLLGCTNTFIYGNRIGTEFSGTWPMGNGQDGIYIQGNGGTTIGGSGGLANVIQFNNGAGVNVTTGSRNSIIANSIYDNRGLGIDLGGDGVTTNDLGDADLGPNELMNYPELASASFVGGSVQIQGGLNSHSSTTYRLDFFASPAWDPTGMPEGQLYLGSTNVTTDPGGTASFNASLATLAPSNSLVTATATDPSGNTSEFSAGIQLLGKPGVSLAISSDGRSETVSWPSAAGAFQLEATGSLNPPVQWHAISGGVIDEGLQKRYVVTNRPPTNQFFRLAR